jgi:hypothetical protein
MYDAQNRSVVMEQTNRYGGAFQSFQKIARAVVRINNPAERVSGKYVASLLTPPIAINERQQFSTEKHFDFDINLSFVS